MRLNIYTQELTGECELVSTTADTGVTYYGVRWYLASPDVLHHTPTDDDRTAITFWIPNARSFTQENLADLFDKFAALVREAPPVPRND